MCKSNPSLKDIVNLYGDDFRCTHKIPYSHHKVLNAIGSCHTASLGSHIVKCTSHGCDYEKEVFNSCRNRHCASCQSYQSAKWVLDRETELLPVPYFHVVFTVPDNLNPLFLWNGKSLYHLLFQSAWESVAGLTGDRRRFGGQAGAIAVLHTWGQTLMDHPHVHMIVPGGAIDKGENVWKQKTAKGQKPFLVPAGPLKFLFKNKFLVGLGKLYRKGELMIPDAGRPSPDAFYTMKETAYQKKWNVWIEKPFAGPEQVIRYLGGYTHRVAISNSRILSINDGVVRFTYKNYRKGGAKEVMALPAMEFLRRFMLHVLPEGFRKIRMFGFLANRFKNRNLEIIRGLLNVSPMVKKVKTVVHEVIQRFYGKNILKCPKCGCDSLKFCYGSRDSFSGGYG
jgi:hypothetical protein